MCTQPSSCSSHYPRYLALLIQTQPFGIIGITPLAPLLPVQISPPFYQYKQCAFYIHPTQTIYFGYPPIPHRIILTLPPTKTQCILGILYSVYFRLHLPPPLVYFGYLPPPLSVHIVFFVSPLPSPNKDREVLISLALQTLNIYRSFSHFLRLLQPL